jgi:hypothetical protein
VVPFRDRGPGLRLRNLLACLLALRDQSVPRSSYQVVVVETDDEPRLRDSIEPRTDHYHDPLLHMYHPSSAVLREDGELVNAHIPALSWGPSAEPIGDVHRFTQPAAAGPQHAPHERRADSHVS